MAEVGGRYIVCTGASPWPSPGGRGRCVELQDDLVAIVDEAGLVLTTPEPFSMFSPIQRFSAS